MLALPSSQTVGHSKWQSGDSNPSLRAMVCDGGRGQRRFQEAERSLEKEDCQEKEKATGG